MDTSKTYIKMCDCPEIQEKWKPKNWKSYTLCQGQIQEMMGDFNIVLPMLPRLERLDKKYNEEFNSMEQLWLAFYMYEKHQKTWDGKKWMKTGGDT